MNMPLIGLTTYDVDERGRYGLPDQYVTSVAQAGGLPVLLPPLGDRKLDDAWLDRLDGLVLSGGGDIDPQRYGHASHPEVYHVDETRDDVELSLARKALERHLPTLAICRGMQIVNVAMGGTLYPHLPDVYGNQVAHRLPPRHPLTHDVELVAGSRLARVLGETTVNTVSWHHQCVHDVAPGFVACAHAADGVIEAIESPDHPELIAVEWHPEMSAAWDATQRKLFDWLVACSNA